MNEPTAVFLENNIEHFLASILDGSGDLCFRLGTIKLERAQL
jgi:hypothetical protein